MYHRNLSLSNINDEIWKDILGYEGAYEVSNFGRIRTCERLVKHYLGLRRIKPQIKKQFTDIGGYCVVGLCKEGLSKTRKVHVLLAQAFIPNPENKPQVNHKDGCKHNNILSNLEWVTRSENMKHAFQNNLISPAYGSKNYLTPFSEDDILFIIKSPMSARELSEKYSVRKETIYGIRRGQNWSHFTGIKYEPTKRKL